jgi:hypothetical protein
VSKEEFLKLNDIDKIRVLRFIAIGIIKFKED